MEEKKILGFRKFTSKEGKNCCIVTVLAPYTDREVTHGARGTKAEEVWIPEDYQSAIQDNAVGKMLVVGYSIVGGRAYINSVAVK